jgi:hypothetical protein
MSRSERRDTPSANWRLLDYDQPHVLTVVGSKELGAWTVGARFRVATGLPRTPVIGAFYDATNDLYQPIFGAQNSIRLPTFWEGRKPKADPMAKRTPGIPGPSACHEPFGT